MNWSAVSADLMFAGVLVLAVVVVVVALWGKGEAAFRRDEAALRSAGHVVWFARQKGRGPVTCIWGRFAAPVPFYLHVSNRDPLASLAGQAGIADIAVGHDAGFDARYVVRSNQPEWARAFLDAALCSRLSREDSLQFLTTSVGNTLGPEYWPKDPGRELRDVWMLRVDGHLEGASLEAARAWALELAERMRAFCEGRPHGMAELRCGFLEGR